MIALIGTPLTSAQFTGKRGHTYAFFSVATDLAGNRESTPTAGQASTQASTATTAFISAVCCSTNR